jgi:hypothetical protein
MQNPFDNPGFSMASLTSAINIIPNRYGRMEHSTSFRPNRCVPGRSSSRSKTGCSTCCPRCRPARPARWAAWQAHRALLRHPPHPARRCGAARGSPGHPCLRLGNRDGVRGRRHGAASGDHAQQARDHPGAPAHGRAQGPDPGCRWLGDLRPLRRVRHHPGRPSTSNSPTPAPTSRRRCYDVLRQIEDNLKGEFMTGIHVLCSPEFFDALTTHTPRSRTLTPTGSKGRC